jgi:hypothetical protein
LKRPLRAILKTNLCMVLAVTFFLGTTYGMERFKDNRDGTVTDNATGLVWIKDPEGVPALKGGKIWPHAMQACKELVFAAYGPEEWFVPTIKELQSIVSDTKSKPRIDAVFEALDTFYWSSTTASGQGAKAWTVDFTDGSLQEHAKLSLTKPARLSVRCVRNQNNY